MSNGAATETKFYAVAVRGMRGRKWFAADSSRCGDRAFVEANAADCAARFGHLGLRFAAMDERDVTTLAPKHYRPWDTDADEDEAIDLDALPDSAL